MTRVVLGFFLHLAHEFVLQLMRQEGHQPVELERQNPLVDHVDFAFQHRVIADFGDGCGGLAGFGKRGAFQIGGGGKFGDDIARLQRCDGHAFVAQFFGSSVGKAGDKGFGCKVSRLQWAGHIGGGGGHVEDFAAPLCDHVVADFMAQADQ